MNDKNRLIFSLALVSVVLAALLFGGFYWVTSTLRASTERAMQPVEQANRDLRTQVSRFLNPTPTIIPDPVTIIHEIRTLARLETIQYSVEKIITAESGQGPFGFLFGDRLLLVAHGKVIAGTDLNRIDPRDIWMEGKVLYLRLPEPEIFIATLENDKSYIYNRDTGLLKQADRDLETKARQAAEAEILKAAVQDGILNQARINAENYLSRLLRGLGYAEVIFIYPRSTPTPAPAPL
jgi:hypothetical protein